MNGETDSDPAVEPAPADLPRWKKAVFAALPVVALLLLLVGAEVGLRIAGYQSPAADPYESFVLHRPLFEQVGRFMRTNPARTKFFHPQRFLRAKPPGTLRFFAFGGSATFGYKLPEPWQDSYVHRLAGALSDSAAAPAEGINCGGISYASYRLVGLVEECLEYQPDFMVAMSGNNEFLEPRHYGALMKEQGAAARWWYDLRLVQWIQTVAAGARSDQSDAGGEMVLAADEIDEKYIVRDEEEFRHTLEHYERNLGQMIDACRAANVPIILCTVPSNLRDWPPFRSEPGGFLSVAELEERLEQVSRLEKEGRHQSALDLALTTVKADPKAAVFHFAAARNLDALGRIDQATEQYRLARDTDAFPHRARTSFNDTVRRIARQRGVPLFDAAAAFAAASPDGIPGKNLFVDQCHPNQRGHQLIADGLKDLIRAEVLSREP